MSDDAAREQTQEPAAPKRHGRSPRKNTIGRVLLASAVVLALATGLGVVYLYRHLNGNLDVVDVTEQLGTDRPEKEADRRPAGAPQHPRHGLRRPRRGRATTSTTRSSAAATAPTRRSSCTSRRTGSARTASASRATRSSTRPTCKTEDGEAIPGGTDVMWNEAFALGGPACTIRQFEKNTGVFIDHYVVIDFAGFEGMVDAIDGVPVCIPEDIVDPAHGINIPAGTREVEGREALNYVRARYTLGDGSDISRIKRQQAFIAAMANKADLGRHPRPRRPAGRLPRRRHELAAGRPRPRQRHQDRQDGRRVPGHRPREHPVRHGAVRVRPAAGVQRPGLLAAPGRRTLWAKIAADEPLTKRLTSDAISAAKPTGSDNEEKSGPSSKPSPRCLSGGSRGSGGERAVRMSTRKTSRTSRPRRAVAGSPRCSARCCRTRPPASGTEGPDDRGDGDTWLRAQVPPHHG